MTFITKLISYHPFRQALLRTTHNCSVCYITGTQVYQFTKFNSLDPNLISLDVNLSTVQPQSPPTDLNQGNRVIPSTRSILLVTSQVQPIDSSRLMSPTLLYRMALKLHFTDCCRSFQNEISKQEHNPTNSQQKNSTIRLLLITKTVIHIANIARSHMNCS